MVSGVQKKGTFSHFQHNQDYLEQKSFYSRKYRQSAISEPILVTFGGCQNCQNQTFNWPYQLYKSKYEKYFFVKRNTIMLFCMYQVFSSLLGHLHFFVHFSFTFMEHLFYGHPIPWELKKICSLNGCPIKNCSIKVKKKCTKK